MNNIFTWIIAIHRLDLEAKKCFMQKNTSCFNHGAKHREAQKKRNQPTCPLNMVILITFYRSGCETNNERIFIEIYTSMQTISLEMSFSSAVNIFSPAPCVCVHSKINYTHSATCFVGPSELQRVRLIWMRLEANQIEAEKKTKDNKCIGQVLQSMCVSMLVMMLWYI